MYKFVGVNVSHVEFLDRYSRLGPRHLVPPEVVHGADEDLQARTCGALASNLLVDDSSSAYGSGGLDARLKYEMGRTKIFIRYACVVCVGGCRQSALDNLYAVLYLLHFFSTPSGEFLFAITSRFDRSHECQ